ncbi:MAG: ROK family transcriptional regulator [Lachnospiraceae bacterium]|nr:ROK family transcriptional regulator [Lachnospiraceae bacterium]
MKQSTEKKSIEKRNIAKCKILDFMLNQGSTTKADIAKQLNLSMPTVLSNIGELTEKGLVMEVGEMESTGGRKARRISLKEDYYYAVGVDITAHHIGMVLVNFGGKIIQQQRVRFDFQTDIAYCRQLAAQIQEFYKDIAAEEKILGIGISLPGIINEKERVLVKSHALQLENYSLKMIEQLFSLPVYFENDANAAMLAENPRQLGDVVYLSLNNTLGGAVCIDGRLFSGQNCKAGEFGHMILLPGGKQCYCGKEGCADAYCAASVLSDNGKRSLDTFMQMLGTDADADRQWEEYLENLAMLISNVRMIFDTDIILGGDVGGYLEKYMMELAEKVMKYNQFDKDVSYLKNCSYQKEASAVGVAKHFFQLYVNQI